MEDIDELESKITQLQLKVSQLTTTTDSIKTDNSKSYKSSLFNTLKLPVVYYGAVPVCILILLLFLKPTFIMEDVSLDGNFPEKKLSYNKLFVSTIIATSIIAVIIFVYFYRTKSNN